MSASSSGTPSAWTWRTAAIIVSALPASVPSAVRTTPSRAATPAPPSVNVAVAHPRGGDRVGDERDAPARRPPGDDQRVGGDVVAVGDQLDHHVRARERRERDPRFARARAGASR